MASHRSPRPHRKRAVGINPVSLSSLRLRTGDTTEADRIDGFSGAREVRAPRHRTRWTEPLKMSPLHLAEIYASSAALWDIAKEYEEILRKQHRVGRNRECKVADMMVYQLLENQLLSSRAVERFLHDKRNWNVIVDATKKSWPNNPERRLSSEPPTRFQFMRLRDALYKKIPGFHDDYRNKMRIAAVNTARHIGCGQAKDSLTHPSKLNMIMGDATWEQSHFNGLANRTYIDEQTGEIFEGRSDPDAMPFHREGSAPGNYLVSALIRTEHEHERIILDSQYKPIGKGDGTIFTDMAFNLFEPLGTVRGVIYDMALKAADQDRVGSSGRHVLCKVPHTKDDRLRTGVLGECKFETGEKTFTETVTAIDGCPTIVVVNIEGEKMVIPLTRKQTKLRDTTMYNIFQIPDHPLVPISKRGATTMIRPFSSQNDLDANKPRPRYLRSIPLNDPDFERLYGLREDTESMHNDYKHRLVNRRARTVGLDRREMDIRGYQLHQMIVALAAWSIRTGGDVSEFFGQWEPPEQAKKHRAA